MQNTSLTLRVPRALLQDPDGFGGVVDGDSLMGRAVVRDGHLVGLMAAEAGATAMVLPALSEAHCHLDKCHTIHRLADVGGDLMAAINAQMGDKANWTEHDLRTRAARGLREAALAGCGTLRSHVDWGETAAAPLSWQVLTDLAQDTPLEMQCAALTGIDHMADAAFARDVAEQVAASKGVLGSFILYHDNARAGLRNTFAEADRLGLALDFHVDEGLGDFNGLEAIADTALETGFQGPILCGHAVSLLDKAPEDFARIADKLARAGITVCALPITNLYLQGRADGTPDRRGITRLRELHAAGVPITIGSDNVGDAFCPTGAHDPMGALNMAVLGAHLDPPLDRWLPAITTTARAALGLEPQHIDTAPLSALRLCHTATTADLIAGRAPLLPFDQEALT